jgi:hypothetical protein
VFAVALFELWVRLCGLSRLYALERGRWNQSTAYLGLFTMYTGISEDDEGGGDQQNMPTKSWM